MCGIVGVVSSDKDRVDRSKLKSMTDILSHRGPDGSGQWISDNKMVGLGHRRLSVIDISTDGAQPMVSKSGRYIISYNGEIYNFNSLRVELENLSHSFQSHSDTEVILAACDEWGIENALNRLNGMFAIALWDQITSELLLVRDRIGIKPLYYSLHQNTFTFASELRPLVTWRQELPPISKQGLNEFFRLGYVPSPLSIFEGIYKLEPGHILKFCEGQIREKRPYWNLDAVVRSGHENQFLDDVTALTAIEEQLSASIANHMVSDVPIGAFLSGGIDSSTVAALMQKQSSNPIKTFSIGFAESAYNEAIYAGAVAKHLGTDHNELYINDQDALDVIPSIPDIYDEPFADISQIPTYIVSKLARSKVTVALSGDGGDELFGGYNRYLFADQFWRKLSGYPAPLRKITAAAMKYPSERSWDNLFERLKFLIPSSLQMAHPGQKMHKLSAILPTESLRHMHSRLISKWVNPELILNSDWHSQTELFNETLTETDNLSPAIQQSLWDSKTYMVDDILTKVDRASMSVALEARVPLLDHNLVELAWRLPENMKIRDGSGKWILKQLLHKYVPQSLFDRPKMGFAVPVDRWLRGSLSEWADDHFEKNKLQQQGYLDTTHLRNTWDLHLMGKTESGAELWTALIFQQWLEKTKTWL